MTFFESLKKWFYTKNSSAASSDARVPLLDASGNPKGSDTMANIASVLGDGNLRIKHGNVTQSQLDNIKDNFGEAYVMMAESPFGEEGFVFIDKIIVHVETIIKQTFVAYDGSICGYRVWNWSSNSWGSWYRGTLDMPTFYKDYADLSSLASALGVYGRIGSFTISGGETVVIGEKLGGGRCIVGFVESNYTGTSFFGHVSYIGELTKIIDAQNNVSYGENSQGQIRLFYDTTEYRLHINLNVDRILTFNYFILD